MKKNKRHKEERAVVTFIQSPSNKNVLIWLPGRNDTFYHVHVLQRLLDQGFDVFALDCRRAGFAKFNQNGEQIVPDILSHDSYNFEEYIEVCFLLVFRYW